jgi:hypothetical protein
MNDSVHAAGNKNLRCSRAVRAVHIISSAILRHTVQCGGLSAHMCTMQQCCAGSAMSQLAAASKYIVVCHRRASMRLMLKPCPHNLSGNRRPRPSSRNNLTPILQASFFLMWCVDPGLKRVY